MPKRKPPRPTLRELGQVTLAAIQGDADATLWLLDRMPVEAALKLNTKRWRGDPAPTLH